jgi:hypothetical protein
MLKIDNKLKPPLKILLDDIQEINNRIKNEVCYETIEKLKDINMMEDYKKCQSVINQIDKLDKILEKHNISFDSRNKIINDYMIELVPPGTKGVLRGNKFNTIVKEKIYTMNLDTSRFEISFEKQCPTHKTTEIPDWYILEKKTNKVLIGMNQLDLIGGGQQLNRGSKYLIDNKDNTEKSKLLCVICNFIKFTSKKNKAFHLFDIGFRNNTLCYLNNLNRIILNYFAQDNI